MCIPNARWPWLWWLNGKGTGVLALLTSTRKEAPLEYIMGDLPLWEHTWSHEVVAAQTDVWKIDYLKAPTKPRRFHTHLSSITQGDQGVLKVSHKR